MALLASRGVTLTSVCPAAWSPAWGSQSLGPVRSLVEPPPSLRTAAPVPPPADGVHEDVPDPVSHRVRASERSHCEVCQVCWRRTVGGWEGGGTDKRRTVETGGGPRGLLREVPLLAVMLGEAPSSGRVRWRCLSCLHTLLLSEPQGTFLSVSVCSR